MPKLVCAKILVVIHFIFIFCIQGQLHDGHVVAVKKCFDLPSSHNQLDVQDLEFQNEIYFLTKLQHTNIVKLLGDCMQGSDRILVYEYMLNGSLDTFIFGTYPLLHLIFLDKIYVLIW